MKLAASPFDTDHYGVPVGRLSIDDAGEVAAALREARTQGFSVVIVRVPDGSPVGAALAPAQPLETLVTLARVEARRPARRDDIAVTSHDRVDDDRTVEDIATLTAAAITRSHLHADPRLAPEATRKLYAAWARNDVRGRAQRTFVARLDGRVVGYLAALHVSPADGVIDLIAVDPVRHGGGIGTALMHAFVDWAEARGLAMRVGTQSDNPVRTLYARFGFVPATFDATYHLWLP